MVRNVIENEDNIVINVTDVITLQIPYNKIPCNKASLLRARHGFP